LRNASRHLALVALFSLAANLQALEASHYVQERIEWLMFQTELTIDGQPILSRTLLPELYAANEYQLFWQDRARFDQLVDLAAFAHGQGLDPEDYALEMLSDRMGRAGLPKAPVARAELDLLATEILVRIAYQLRFGKINPYNLFQDWNFNRSLLPGADPVEVILEIIRADQLREAVTRALSRGPLYEMLVGALADQRAIAAAGGWPEVPAGPTLRPDDDNDRVRSLRQRLIVSGDLQGEASTTVFDAGLERAVKDFQARHGLDPDGLVGPGTLAALNVPVESRIEQIRASLERGRWVFEDLMMADEQMVVVNIAAAEVSLFHGREVHWQARAQIGRPYRQTPVFRDDIEYLVFNPTWTVPPTILKNDVLPRLLADPAGYLAEKDMELLNRDGQPQALDTIDFSGLGPNNFPYIVRQRPGPTNSLGLIKFIFPNPHFVFLHDTPSRDLFLRPGRAFSSGCVRVEQPFELAELLLGNPGTWNQQSFQEVLDSRKIRTVHLPDPVPVFLMYLTADVGPDGAIRFFDDIYGRDETLLQALAEDPSFSPP
jgi:murein L,D-transpeptidase YcbB/YkuD